MSKTTKVTRKELRRLILETLEIREMTVSEITDELVEVKT